MSKSNETQEYIQLTGNLTAKELKDQDLLEIHKKLYLKYIKVKINSLQTRNTAERVYDALVNTKNIRLYYNRKISIFTPALLTGNLESIIKHSTF